MTVENLKFIVKRKRSCRHELFPTCLKSSSSFSSTLPVINEALPRFLYNHCIHACLYKKIALQAKMPVF